MVNKIFYLFIIFNIIFLNSVFTQKDIIRTRFKPVKDKIVSIAIVAPLFLDSLYNSKSKLVIEDYQDYLSLGWDYYAGVKFAIDSVKKQVQYSNLKLVFYIYDTKTVTIEDKEQDVIKLSNEFCKQKYDLIIGTPMKKSMVAIAEYANKNQIPFISVFYPNPSTQYDNTNLIMLNPQFKTHIIELIQHFSVANQGKPIDIIYKEDENSPLVLGIYDYLKSSPLVTKKTIRLVPLSSNFTLKANSKIKLANTKNFFVLLSLDTAFTNKFILEANILCSKFNKSGTMIIGGPPAWKNLSLFKSNKLSEKISLVYTEPFYFPPNNTTHIIINDNIVKQYENLFFSQPSEMFWLGYESLLFFTNHLIQNPRLTDFLGKLNLNTNSLYTKYCFYNKSGIISPASLSLKNGSIENHHLYFFYMKGSVLKIVEN